MRPLLPLLVLLLANPAFPATPEQTQTFLHDYTHSWCPYALPRETSFAEIEKVAALGFDTVGISFVGSYNGGDIDFATLDDALKLLEKRSQRAVLHLMPRFLETEGVSDRLDNGKVITATWNKNPNYSMIDVFDPAQRTKFDDWISRVARRYGKDKRVAAFVIGWGYQGETGFYNGDWNTKYEYMGAECAGYSRHALSEFNNWRARKKLPPVDELPRPTDDWQSPDYVLFHRFRSEFVRDVFQHGYIAAAKRHTQLPVGTFAYLSADKNSYARDWVDTPNADFYRTAGSAASFDLARTLVDSGIGYEDASLHDGNWDFTSAAMMRDEARQLARGAVFHAMYCRVYATDSRWEKKVFAKVASFLRTQQLAKKVRRTKPTIALYQPTWGAAVLPPKSMSQPFIPKVEYWNCLLKTIGLVESFGLPYELVTEADLLELSRLKGYRHIIVPMWDQMPKVVGEARFTALSEDRRVMKIPLKEWAYTRSEFREMLKKAGIEPRLDFDAEKALAGRVHNLVYNCDDKPIRVRIPEREGKTELAPHQYVFIGP